MSQTLSLFRLQQTDLQIDHIQTRLHDIQNKLDDNQDLHFAKEQENLSKVKFQASEQALKQAEAAVIAHRIKIEQTDASLYGSKSHSPKELQELQADLISLKRLQVTLEDAQLEAMFAFEEAEKLLEANQKLSLTVTDKSNDNRAYAKDPSVSGETPGCTPLLDCTAARDWGTIGCSVPTSAGPSFFSGRGEWS
jgi:predicted  nucleic acid-binding Zn-ribbon protein